MLKFCKIVLLAAAIFGGDLAAAGQYNPASAPIADPFDTRFAGVKEDFTSPALQSSKLKPVPPLTGYINDYSTYSAELLQVQWRWGDPLDLYVLKPKGIKNPPVIIYLYGYPSDTDSFKSQAWQRAVTKDGFAAVGFVSALTGHRYHDRPMKEWFVSELQECLAVSTHDVQMVLDYLGTRGDLDMNRVGMFSEGSGASIGILASAVDSRIKVLDAIDPWGDWPEWMAKSPVVPDEERPSYLKVAYLKKIAPLDPVEWLPRVQAKNVRMQEISFEPSTPTAAKEKLRQSVAVGATVTVYNTAQEYNAIVNRNRVMDWLHSELRSLTDDSTPDISAQKR